MRQPNTWVRDENQITQDRPLPAIRSGHDQAGPATIGSSSAGRRHRMAVPEQSGSFRPSINALTDSEAVQLAKMITTIESMI